MDEYGNIKAGQFKNDPLSLAMATVPVFPPRCLPGAGNPFQNPPMSTHYGFNMDGTLGHATSIYNPPTQHPNHFKINSRPVGPDVRQMSHGFPKPHSMQYHSFSPINSCNIVTTNAVFNLNVPPDTSKHSFDDVLNSPPNFNTDPSINAQIMSSKTQYLEPVSSVMTDISQFSQETINSYVQNLTPITQVTQMDPKKRSKGQKVSAPKSAVTNILEIESVDSGQPENDNTLQNKIMNDNNFICAGSEITSSSDMLSKLSTGMSMYKCGFCDLKVLSNEALLGHLNTHINLLPYHCGICGVAFVESSQLMKHVQHSHAVKAPYACGLCTSAFHQNEELKAHMNTHEKPNGSGSLTRVPSIHVLKEKEKPISKASVNLKEEDTGGEGDDDDDDDDDDEDNNDGDPENLDPASIRGNPAANTIVIGKDTDFTLRRGPSKIVMDDVDLNSACTIIVEPSSAGGIRKKHLFKCNYCDKVCKDKGSLVSHVRTHTKGRPYECNSCFAKFKQYAHLSDHIMTKHTKERPFVCDRCAKTFNRKSHLQDHIRLRHTEDKLYHCPECPATFQKRSEFSDHKRTHGKPPPKYQCNMCPRQFRNVTDYERHIRSHTKEKRYECEVCHLTFGLLANAKKHMIKHNEERPFKCDVCPKAYHFEHDFKRHKMTHLKKKPFPCPDCYKSFKKAALLKKHAKEAHLKNEEDPTKKPFKCLACKKRFKFQWDLDRHRKIHMKKKPFPCLYCYKTYGSEAMLTKHTKVHEGQDLPLYDHSKDILDESEADNKPKKRGRKPKLKSESDEQLQDQVENSESDRMPKRRGRPPKRKTETQDTESTASKRRGRPSKSKNDSETDDPSAPRLKITFRRNKLNKGKLKCGNCSKVFLSKALLNKHVKVHENESDDDTESFTYSESTNDVSYNDTADDTTLLKNKITVKSRKTNCTDRKEATVDETTRDDETTEDDDTTRDNDITRDHTSTTGNKDSRTSAFTYLIDHARETTRNIRSGHFSQINDSKENAVSQVPLHSTNISAARSGKSYVHLKTYTNDTVI